ncbi:MAG: hypothetical protein LKK19_04340 [Bacteroidales bacterium]|jgi:phage repressor protein C with HTH and peptisase S24 domain|nr:hypothetical protein [Bacteroidales bacterium]MCI2121914.1 hypothetical protein [Bacteroidales bacterium]
MMNKQERLEAVYKNLRSGGLVRTKKDFASAIGVSYPNISSALNGNEAYLTCNLFKKVHSRYPKFNTNWLITGEGEMIIDSKEIYNAPKSEDKLSHYELVPLYNLDSVGGFRSSNDIMDNPTYIEKYIPFPGAVKGDFCIHVTGNSMTPLYSPGSIILVREVKGWREYFGYGNSFVILLKDGRRILKQVKESRKDTKENVLCVSFNQSYPDEELPKNMILNVYKVIMTLTVEGF